MLRAGQACRRQLKSLPASFLALNHGMEQPRSRRKSADQVYCVPLQLQQIPDQVQGSTAARAEEDLQRSRQALWLMKSARLLE